MTQVLDEDRKARLFWACCIALISTSIAFGVITEGIGDIKAEYGLTNTQSGWVLGSALGGFFISIILLGPVIEKIGIAVSLKSAFVCHIAGVILMMYSGSYIQLIVGASFIALGNGCVEAGCNPLVATMYSDNKTTKLNQFHVFWPVGIIVGGLFGFWVSGAVDAAVASGALATDWTLFGLSALQAKLALILVPTLIYGFMFLGQEIPQTERVQSRVSDEEVKSAVSSPLFILLLCCMGLTATLEIGPGHWMAASMKDVLADADITNGGILVLVYGAALMAILRYFAGGFVHRFSPTGLLFGSAVVGGIGLFAMTYATTLNAVFLTATVFFAGICFFWPTMLGFVSERIPNSGALGLCLMGGVGMLVAGYVAMPAIGAIQDNYLIAQVNEGQGWTSLPFELVTENDADGNPPAAIDAQIQAGLIAQGVAGADAENVVKSASLFAGRMSFRWIAALAIPLALVFFNLHKRFGNVPVVSVGSSSRATGNEQIEVQNSF